MRNGHDGISQNCDAAQEPVPSILIQQAQLVVHIAVVEDYLADLIKS
jgi:hypothetical protein